MPDPSGIQQLKRLGYTVPRRVLLPPYMQDPYFVQYMNMIDAVYKPLVDDKVAVLRELRTGWHLNPDVENLILNNKMVDNEVWDYLERNLVTEQVNNLGLFLSGASSIPEVSLQNIARWLGTFWWERGTYGFIEFINFCLGINISMQNMWAQVDPSNPDDAAYINMTPENDDGTPPGTPIWDGGTWFPTTHVQLTAVAGTQPLPIKATDLVQFFYEIANYNLVLYAINNVFNANAVTEGADNVQAVCIGYFTKFSVAAVFTETST